MHTDTQIYGALLRMAPTVIGFVDEASSRMALYCHWLETGKLDSSRDEELFTTWIALACISPSLETPCADQQ